MNSLICYELEFINFMCSCIRFMDYSLDLTRKILHLLLIVFSLTISEIIIVNGSIGLKKWRGRKLVQRDIGEMSCQTSNIVVLSNISRNGDDGSAVGNLKYGYNQKGDEEDVEGWRGVDGDHNGYSQHAKDNEDEATPVTNLEIQKCLIVYSIRCCNGRLLFNREQLLNVLFRFRHFIVSIMVLQFRQVSNYTMSIFAIYINNQQHQPSSKEQWKYYPYLPSIKQTGKCQRRCKPEL